MFDVHSRAVHDVEPLVIVKLANNANPAIGTAMTAAGAVCGATATPEYIAAGARIPDGDDYYIPAYRVMPHIVFKADINSDATVASIAVGTAYTIPSGNSVSSTSSSGVFTVTKIDATAGVVYGHF